ncbi:MAG: NDP-sugar synthase [Muribaculaceae bacterium]
MNFAIIAAGEGSRLVAEGVAAPKPLVNLDGRPMIRRLVDIMVDAGAETIAIIVNEHMTEVARYINEVLAVELPVPVRLVVKTTPDSMHSFYEVARLLGDGKFILTTVDTIFSPVAFKKYATAFESNDSLDGFMAVSDYIDDEKPLYVAVDEQMHITGFLDAPTSGIKYVSGGIYGLHMPRAAQILDDCMSRGVSRMRNYQRALVDAGLRLKAVPLGKIIDVDHSSDIVKARTLIQEFENER